MGVLLPIYMYHQIVPQEKLGPRPYLRLTPEVLTAQINDLLGKGFQFINLWQAWRVISLQNRNRKYAVLTFDDLDEAFLHNAWPVLRAFKIPATGFVATGDLQPDSSASEKSERLTPDALRALNKGGLEIGSHTVKHCNLLKLGTEELRRELRESKQMLEDTLGHPVPCFCYPEGGFTARVMDIVKEAEYLCACTTLRGCVHERTDRFRLKRIRAHMDRLGWKLKYTTSGLYDWWSARHNRRQLAAMLEADNEAPLLPR